MGKKHSYRNPLDFESLAAPIAEVKYSDPLFSVAAHPSRPVIVAGLGTGHVFCHTYEPETLESSLAAKRGDFLRGNKDKVSVSRLRDRWWQYSPNHTEMEGAIVNAWKTKRHKGSCRAVMFDTLEGSVGEHVYTAGTDHVIKKALAETGKVVARADLSAHFEKDAVTVMAASSSNPFLLAGTENGHILVYDSRTLGNALQYPKLTNMHEDTVAKILPMSDVSAYHYLSLGSSTLTHLDIRKGIVTQSDDQGDELMSMCYPTNFVNGGKNDTVVVSHGEGILTLWRNSINKWMDQLSRIKINKNASIDAIIATMNNGDAHMADCVWCGDSDGFLHRVDYKKGKVQEVRVHLAKDEVGGLDIDYEYRLVSSGMERMKIWGTEVEIERDSESESDSESDSGSDSESEVEGDEVAEEEGASDSENDENDGDSGDDSDSENDGDSGDDSDTDSESAKGGIVRRKRVIGKAEPKKQKGKEKLKVKKLCVNKGITKFAGL